ncbi:probable protein phosphatase CG10417 [Nilaparvata lugens]|uniref:probable protein phosphatase CG10417 n=1 Tax=Nilaparvata lugens TaxID=108931 RepID=UPI00193D5234|nr:probable protein phosphatase CG10417 [Nilaparvata lugens]
MGGYLSEPIKDKESADFESDRLICGASSMQGWRENQEDAHNCCLNYDENVSFFAVYDGHGGQEVAQYCEKNLPDFIKNTEAYKKGDYEKALIDGFLGFDATIITPEVIKVLEQMSGRKLNGSDVEDESEENVKDLFLEAKMPLDQLVAKYRQEGAKIKFDSPAIKSRKDDGAGPSTSKSGVMAGCSKSSEPSSSSSELTNGEVLVNGDKHEAECSKQQPEASSAVGSSSSPKAEVASPSKAEAASSSKAEVASPSKAEAASSSKAELTSPSKAEAASSSKAEMASPSKAEAAGSSKSDAGSCSKSEVPKPEVSSTNGEVDDHDESEKPKTRRNQSLTRKLLMSADDSDDDDDEDSEDLDFENAQASDDDDDDEGDSVAVEMDDEDGEDDEDEDEDDDDEEEDEDDDECDGRFSVLPEEPGMDSGCTAVVALLAGNNLYVANAGDSRCIVCRNGEAIEMSIDHKPEDAPEMERILAAGGTVKEGRVNKGLNLSRAIGDFTYKKNSALPPTEQMIIALPDVKKLEVDTAQDEFMVLACDGIWNSMTSQEVVDFVKPKLHEGVPVSKICEQMFDHCLAPNTLGDGTGCDNMTCIIVKFKSNDSPLEVPPVVKRRCASPDDQECQDRPKRQKTDESLTGSD